jgi:N-acetylneuraminic acid mutarotase
LSDPKAWEELPGGPPLQGLALVTHKGTIYRIGGMQPRNAAGQTADNYSLPDCARFDLHDNQWHKLPDLPDGRSSHDAVVVGDRLYVLGGWKMNGGGNKPRWHETACVLDFGCKPLKWESVPQPFARRALTAAVLGGKVYIIGGMNAESRIERTVNIFDAASGRWSIGPELPGITRNGFTAAACVAGACLYVSPADGKLYRLSAKGAAWQEAGALVQPRIVHRMVAGDGGRLIVLGGASKQGNVARTETVEPAVAAPIKTSSSSPE